MAQSQSDIKGFLVKNNHRQLDIMHYMHVEKMHWLGNVTLEDLPLKLKYIHYLTMATGQNNYVS